ncbi:MAG: DUF370 domain-containing protein [Clostridiaceae bacterium]|nr:DUF370 domain-containing protein [Clostridiaceae bacterium]
MKVGFIQVGFGNLVNAERVVALVSAEAAPARRLIQDARDRGTLIDASAGRRTRSVLIMDSDHVVLSGVAPAALAKLLGRSAELEPDTEE